MERNNKIAAFKRWTNNRTTLVETDADVKWACVAALSHEQIDDQMQRAPSAVNCFDYGSNFDAMMTRA